MAAVSIACRALAVSIAGFVAGCGIPSFDIPIQQGAPTVTTIVQRVTCELVDMVRDDGGYENRTTVLTGDYQVTVQLSLDVTDSGELSPNLNFPSTDTFAFNAGLKLSRSRDQNFTQNLLFSMQDLHDRWKTNKQFGRCPTANTNLAGDLGIKNTVSLALTAPFRDPASKDGEFGGSVNFVVTRNVNAVGPTWTLKHFEGPGNLGTLSRVNNDKITFAFARVSGKPSAQTRAEGTKRAQDFLNQLLLNQITVSPLR
ncbi:hypothetical protein LJR231_000499 [Phyllobacterium sp. LjRoot231]|uniref:hypothetical protein n=1 Tax=Phyllobacterium sp. LjRoot231 TaxID=3342289 RepID=UPI003ECD6B19